MTRNKTISSLSIAAIALMVVAVPSFAQAQATEPAQTSIVAQAGEQTTISNLELSAVLKSRVVPTAAGEVERPSVNNAARAASQPRLSASAFKVQNTLSFATSSHFVTPQLTFSDVSLSDPEARKQFRADDDASNIQGRKAVTFVPSRGQKLPE